MAVLIFGVLIFVHELGHFLVAKRTGVQVNEFALCMGPTLWSKKWGETTYSLRAIPIGGFCAMEGEDEDSENPRAFTSAAVWKRFYILIAGSAMNFLAGLLILVIIFSFAAGFTSTTLSGFTDGATIAEETGLQEGDTFYRIDGQRVYFFQDISLLLNRNSTGNYALEVIRDGKVTDLGTVPMIPKEFDFDGEKRLAYGLKFVAREKSVGAVLEEAWFSSIYFCRLVWMGLGDLVSGMVGLDDMSGPVGIVSQIAQTGKNSATATDAALNIAYFAAFLAVNLAVMNMLPIPALDGGRAFFLLISAAIEKITKKKISPKFEGYIHAAGMLLLLGFIALITLKDIVKLFR